MTTKLFSRALTLKSSRAALALLIGALLIGALPIGFAMSTTAFAAELKAPSAKSRLLRDNDDVTIVIIDEDDNRSTSQTGKASKSRSSTLKPPSTRIRRDDDELTIRFKRDRSTSSARSGPKIIIIDKNSGSCDGGGVCVIRP